MHFLVFLAALVQAKTKLFENIKPTHFRPVQLLQDIKPKPVPKLIDFIPNSNFNSPIVPSDEFNDNDD
jgi:hypothetical protein